MDSFRSRFLSKIEIENGCWLWVASTDRYGYGKFSVNGKKLKAHRVSYTEFRGTINEGMVLDHLCRNRNCVNPLHLEPVTMEENTRRGFAARKSNN